ncbi:hypothetical protein BJ912DRAFT_1056162 [Pholiota molesta]|nr:hypothetical protein BJ912DRAFT_1056162 [Pholiota molesta]
MAREREQPPPEPDGVSARPVRHSAKNLLDKPTWVPKQTKKKPTAADQRAPSSEKNGHTTELSARASHTSGQKRPAGISDIPRTNGHSEPKRAKTLAPQASKKPRKYGPPVIVDDGESDNVVVLAEVPVRIHRTYENHNAKASKHRRDEDYEEEDEEHEDMQEEERESEEDEIDEREHQVNAADLFDERVIVKDRGYRDRDEPRRARSHSASSSTHHDGPPTTDDDDSFDRGINDDINDEHEGVNLPGAESGDEFERELSAASKSRRGRTVTVKRQNAIDKKLESERPTFVTKKRPSDEQARSEDEGDDDSDWMSRTKIQLSYQNSTPRVNLKDQSGIMQAVIRRALDLGEVYLVLGTPDAHDLSPEGAATMNTPFSIAGLHSLAITALVSAAQEHGYNKERDIAERLTEGSERYYIKPLRTHVFQRLSLARSHILSKITTALPSVIKVDKTSKVILGRLLTKSSYIFPLKEGSQDKFVTTKAYQSDIIVESLKIGFGRLENIRVPKLYASSHKDFEQEREIPPYMVALAATTAHGILQHLLYDGTGDLTDFSTPALQSIFQAHMVRLLEWKRRRAQLFHKYMHQQYKTVIGIGSRIVGDQTTDDIINEVDWDNMMDSDDAPPGAG